MTEQLYFGRQDRKLFGVYHPALDISSALPAILICNPFGVEAVTAHRLLRVLAIHLAEAGMPVLRFDYYGCGESAGADEDFTLMGAGEDILTAHQELVDRLGSTRRIIWLGIRLGAALVLQVSAATQAVSRIIRHRPRQLVLWDCIIRGNAYLTELRLAHRAALARVMDLSEGRIARYYAADLEGQVMGFSLTDALVAEIAGITISGIVTGQPAGRVMMIESAGHADRDESRADIADLNHVLDAHGCHTERLLLEDPVNWLTHNSRDPLYMPYAAIRALTEKLVGAA